MITLSSGVLDSLDKSFVELLVVGGLSNSCLLVVLLKVFNSVDRE